MGDTSYNAEEEAISAAKDLENFVNPMGCDLKAFIDQMTYRTHRTLQQSVGKLVFMLIKRWAEMYHKDMYDGRNADLCDACDKIDRFMTKEQGDHWNYLPMI